MKTFLTWIALVMLAVLIWLGAIVITRHIEMQKALDPLEMEFEMVVMDHFQNHAPYAGRIDRIIVERNKMLRDAHYLWVGTWSTSAGLDPIYLKASWLPEDIYQYAWRNANRPSGNAVDFIAMALIFIVPLFAYFGAFVFAIWFTRRIRRS